jgi:hypothetical protein
VNTLIDPDYLDPISGFPGFKSLLCSVRRIGPPPARGNGHAANAARRNGHAADEPRDGEEAQS